MEKQRKREEEERLHEEKHKKWQKEQEWQTRKEQAQITDNNDAQNVSIKRFDSPVKSPTVVLHFTIGFTPSPVHKQRSTLLKHKVKLIIIHSI